MHGEIIQKNQSKADENKLHLHASMLSISCWLLNDNEIASSYFQAKFGSEVDVSNTNGNFR